MSHILWAQLARTTSEVRFLLDWATRALEESQHANADQQEEK